MTKNEMKDFFMFSHMTKIAKAFKLAEQDCPSILQKKGHYSKMVEVDYTLEECLAAIKYLPNIDYGCTITPAMIQVFTETFIHRDTPIKVKHKEIKLNTHAKDWLYIKRIKKFRKQACCCCMFLILKTPNAAGRKPTPFCTFYDCFLNKVKPKRDIYKDRCPTFKMDWGKHVPILTTNGYVSEFMIDRHFKVKTNNKMMGIKQSEFKSKRKKDEPIVILKDAFEPTL